MTSAEHRSHYQQYVADLVRPYGFGPTSDADGHSYGEMGAALLRELAGTAEPVDVLVLAFAVPDVRPGRATATYLSHLCPGRPLAFAVCDQGAAAAFTGLRLVGEYLRGEYRRALLLLLEQAGLPYEPGRDAGAPLDLPTAHRVVGLRCETTGPVEVESVRQYAGVPPDRSVAMLATELADGGDLTLVADAGLADQVAGAVPVARVRAAPAGRPLTGVWWELAGLLSEPPGGRVVLASHDRRLRYLCLSTFDVVP